MPRRKGWGASCWLTYTKMIPENKLRKEIMIPDGVKVSLDGELVVRGPKGEVKRTFNEPSVKMELQSNKLVLSPSRMNKNQKRMINTYASHIRNMLHGVQELYEYKLKICSSHFPMSTSIEGNQFLVKNFLGEKVPRKSSILPNTKVTIQGDTVTVSGPDLESVGQTAANIEQSTRITNRDRRVFQDGLWIVSKAGAEVGR